MKKKITIITVEQERVIEIRLKGRRRENTCEQCGCPRLLTTDEAAVVVCVSPQVILGWVETASLHFTQSRNGVLLVCFDSLSQRR